jgi:hypothetical protein
MRLAVLLAATALFYIGAGVLSGRLNLVDDYGYIVQFGHYDRSLNLSGLAQMFSSISKQEMLHDYYRPIYTLIRSIDYRLYGTSPTGYHVTSLVFYLLAVASAYWILLQLLPSTWAAFAGALIFAVHPIHVEAVAWIMAGGYAMAGALALAAFALYLSGSTWASTLAFAAAALTNPPAVVMPALVWGHMWLFRAKHAEERRRRWLTFVLMSAAAGGVMYLNFVAFPQRYSGTTFDSAVAARSWLANLFSYLRLMVVPLGLQTPYERYTERLSDPRCLAGAAGGRRRRAWPTAICSLRPSGSSWPRPRSRRRKAMGACWPTVFRQRPARLWHLWELSSLSSLPPSPGSACGPGTIPRRS